MEAGERRAGAVERGVVDLVEALLLSGREGETFEAVVIDEGLLALREPAVRARMKEGCPEPGTEIDGAAGAGGRDRAPGRVRSRIESRPCASC